MKPTDVRQVTQDAQGWPDILWIPGLRNIDHGGYHEVDPVCGTVGCLVGNIGVAFGRALHIPSIGTLAWIEEISYTPAALAFAQTLVEVALERDIVPQISAARARNQLAEGRPIMAAEIVFEQYADVSRLAESMTPRQARGIWIEAAKRHGYDVRARKPWRGKEPDPFQLRQTRVG